MALTGYLETFSLPDVLRLLATTKKTGRLTLDGDRGTGTLWVQDGSLAGAEAERALVASVDDVLFELLRFAQGTFAFEATSSLPTGGGSTRDVEDALRVGEERLAEWREIEAVVPSLDVRLRMVTDIDADLTVTRSDWRVLSRVGTGATGHEVARDLGQGEYELSRHLRDLIQGRLVELIEIEAESTPPTEPEPYLRAQPDAHARPALYGEPRTESGFGFEPVAEPEPEPEIEPEPVAAPEPEPERQPAWAAQAEREPIAPARTGLGRTWSDDQPEPAPAPWPEVKPVSTTSETERADEIDQGLLGRFRNPKH